MDLENKAQKFLSSRNDVDECLITSDGNVFLCSNEAFARSHAYKIGDNKILKVKKSKKTEKKFKSAKSKD